jgi:4'-phosphopantetheinyl transferase
VPHSSGTLASTVEVLTLATDDVPADTIARARQVLSADERRRADRFIRAIDHRTFVVAHALLRQALSAHAPTAPDAWRFDTNPHGCPSVVGAQAGSPPLSFNLSHTHGLVAVAIARGRRVGVDVERVDRTVTEGVAERQFAPAEVAALRALPADERLRTFFDYWTLKEAYIKARGLGLAIPLDAFAFTLRTPAAPSIAFADGFDDRPERWQFWQAWPSPAHRLALAIEREGPDVAVQPRAVPLEALQS